MFPMAAIHADEALRLANDQIDRRRSERDLHRRAAGPARPVGARKGRLQAIASSIGRAFREVETGLPAPRLSDYPYRP
jgi:hypothetical protein